MGSHNTQNVCAAPAVKVAVLDRDLCALDCLDRGYRIEVGMVNAIRRSDGRALNLENPIGVEAVRINVLNSPVPAFTGDEIRNYRIGLFEA